MTEDILSIYLSSA